MKNKKITIQSWLMQGALFMYCAPFALAENDTPPKLIQQITVDQLRANLPKTVFDRLLDGGLNYLNKPCIVYENTNHRHANTETVVGLTTLATCADSSSFGMNGNLRYNEELERTACDLENYRYSLLNPNPGVLKNTEINPFQAGVSTNGSSPSAINSTLFFDELSLFTNGKVKVYGVSVKDRGAIPMAGHMGKTFWFSNATGQFVSSSYYYNQDQYKDYVNTSLELTYDKSNYIHGDDDDMPCETNLPGYGRVFPHNFGNVNNKYFNTFFTISLVDDVLTLDYVKELIVAEDIETDDITDYLSVSFSSTDCMGHIFGSSSLQNADNLIKLDRTLARELQMHKGISFAVPLADLLEENIADISVNQAILRSYNPTRSGEIDIVTKPYWYINDFDRFRFLSTHGSPWKYDTSIPFILAGNCLKNKTVFRKVETVNMALTLSHDLSIITPSASSGKPLIAVLKPNN